MAKRIPRSKFIEFKEGGHLLFGYGREVSNIIKEFIRKH